MKISTELYKIFYHTAKQGSVSGAAKELMISQPAISKQISKLEDLTGCTLFIRHPKGVKLTSEGEALYIHVQKAFAHLEQGEKTIANLTSADEGTVRIGISNTMCKYFFLPHLEAFHEKYPDISIQIINVPSPMALNLLNDAKIDFAVMSYDKKQNTCDYMRLMQLNDIFVSTKEYKEVIPIEGLKALPIMMMEQGNQTRDYIDRFLAEQGIKIKPQIEIGSMDFLIEFAKIGIGTSCVIKEFVLDELKDKSLYELPIEPAPSSRDMGIVTKKNVPLTNGARLFVGMMGVGNRE